MEIPDKAIYAFVAAIGLVTLSTRIQSLQTAPVEEWDEPSMELEADNETSAFRIRTSSMLGMDQKAREPSVTRYADAEAPHTTIGRSTFKFVESEPESDPADEAEPNAEESEMVDDVWADTDVPFDVQFEEAPPALPWSFSDGEVLDQMLSVMGDSERPSFEAQWVTLTPAERNELLQSARLAAAGF